MARLAHNVTKARTGIHTEDVILHPHITEKATDVSANGVYTFVVDQRANKTQIAAAVEKLFKVKPVKINVVNRKSHTVVKRGRGSQKTPGMKKAMVYLKDGDKIEYV